MSRRERIFISLLIILLVMGVLVVVINLYQHQHQHQHQLRHRHHDDTIADNRQVMILHNDALLAQSKMLPLIGYLIQKLNKNLYLKVSDQYITTLYPLVKKDLLQKNENATEIGCLEIRPLRDSHNLGAHILIFKGKKDFVLTKQPYHFVVNNYINAVIFKKYNGTLVKETWYELSVSSPELAARFDHITNPDIFHISIAVAKTRIDNGQCYIPPWRTRLWQWL